METHAQPAGQDAAPSERDFEVYRLVKVESKTTRAVAEIAGISQTRVCQIVQRVLDYLLETAPSGEVQSRQQQRLYLARELAEQRLEYIYGEAIAAYRRSQGPQKTVRTLSNGLGAAVTTTTVKHSDGDGRFLILAGRVAEMAQKRSLPLRLPESSPRRVDTQTPPPVEDCSAKVTEQGVTSPAEVAESVATSESVNTSDVSSDSAIPPKAILPRPVQPLARAALNLE